MYSQSVSGGVQADVVVVDVVVVDHVMSSWPASPSQNNVEKERNIGPLAGNKPRRVYR